MQNNRNALPAISLFMMSVLAACGGGNNNPPQATYEIVVANISSAQVLTPLGVVIHRPGYTAWETGTSASIGLENLAESGNPQPFVDEAALNNQVENIAMGTSAFAAGTTQTINITANHTDDLELSVATMLANTNDAFTGVSSVNIGALSTGEHLVAMPPVYDAGTEANTETAASMPGPVAGGEGFNTARSDTLNLITIHPGVVTQADGLTTSALTEVDRWLGPTARIVVTRTQ